MTFSLCYPGWSPALDIVRGFVEPARGNADDSRQRLGNEALVQASKVKNKVPESRGRVQHENILLLSNKVSVRRKPANAAIKQRDFPTALQNSRNSKLTAQLTYSSQALPHDISSRECRIRRPTTQTLELESWWLYFKTPAERTLTDEPPPPSRASNVKIANNMNFFTTVRPCLPGKFIPTHR